MWCMWDKKVIGKIKNCIGNCNGDVSKYIWENNPLSKQICLFQERLAAKK